MGEPANTTQILVDLGNGDRSAAKRLMPLVYDELRGLAQRYMQQERAEHTFQA
ncbi:MAG: ECF-type sigma factor, partial [Planctomycetota bacterium]